MKEQAEESRKEDSSSTALYRLPAIVLAISPFGASSNIALLRANIKPPVELVVDDLENRPRAGCRDTAYFCTRRADPGTAA